MMITNVLANQVMSARRHFAHFPFISHLFCKQISLIAHRGACRWWQKGLVKEWQACADNKPVYHMLAKSKPHQEQ